MLKKKYKIYDRRLAPYVKMCRNLFNTGIENIDLGDKNNLNSLLISISSYYWLYKDSRCIDLIENIIRNEKTEIDAKVFLYWQLVRNDFINYNAGNERNLKEIFKNILRQVESKGDWGLLEVGEEKRENVVVFITNQFLGNNHSPTKLLLTIVKEFNDNFKEIEKIYIFNSREIPVSNEYSFLNPCIANYVEDYNDEILAYVLRNDEIDRCEIEYEQESGKNNILKRLESIFDKIRKINPKFIISIGGENILAELCNRFTDVYTIPLSGKVPVCETKYIVQLENECVVNEKKINDKQYVIEIPNFMPDITKNIEIRSSYTREQFGIPQEDFVFVVVGNRLSIDITNEFIKLCEDVLSKNRKTDLLIVGNYNKSKLENKVSEEVYKRIYCIGYIDDLISVLKIADLFINPIRSGGGFSVITAINAMVPVISTNVGDGALHLPKEFLVNDYNEMGIIINNLINNKQLLNEYKVKTSELKSKNNKNGWNNFISLIIKK